MLAVQRRGTRPRTGYTSRTPARAEEKRRKGPKGSRCAATTHSGEGCSLSSDEALGRRLDIPVGPQRGREKKRADWQPASTVTLRRRVLAVQRRRTPAKGRCPATGHSSEGCSLSSDEALGRRLDKTSRTEAGAKKKEKRAEGQRASTDRLWRRVLAIPALYSQAIGARCSTRILFGEERSLFSDNTLGRRLDKTSRAPAAARTKKEKRPEGSVLFR